ncbi:hypothetical protein CLU85_2197 [Acidovorax sp. 69]|uniref:hypothetical protein n=1 Tax=Acidovorax sp. 69 TaxID=2035202 RepID=UPI000C2450C0|nr:hypothetical protein [Acidovorax sp. 69]PJI97407.1 hypothetical protein CLU85_2197 [Acidovorax sp. 69]
MRSVPHLVARWLAAALLACAGQAHALGMDVPFESFATAPDVDWIKICGEWPVQPPSEGRGVYRIVHATRYGQSFVYLQWIVRDGNDSAREVHTQSFEAINNDHAEITLSQMNCQPTRNGIRWTARAQSGHDNSVFRITIDAGHKPGEVRFRTRQRR